MKALLFGSPVALATFLLIGNQFVVRGAKVHLEPNSGQDTIAGRLDIRDKIGRRVGICPLLHTTVNASVSGFGARVDVVQTFGNSSETPVEAVYTFPLPHDAAVDRMQIQVGARVIEGSIKRREEARRIYDAAKNAGQTAALLDQERPNIFTQAVANIMPGSKVRVHISYVQILKYQDGQFEFNYPMVVGPRYLGNAKDPDKISAPITPPANRTGTTIDLSVHLDAGAPIRSLQSVLHKIDVQSSDESHSVISLAKRDEIPNRDFILRYQVATDRVQSAFVTSYGPNNGGFFDLILLPPKRPRAEDIAPREMIFVMDQSGSQYGFPIAKSKELTLKLIDSMRPGDTFNVFGFNTEVRSLWSSPQPNTPKNVARAKAFLWAMDANGGTNLLQGLQAALSIPKDPKRLRVVLFNTDGYVGDETNILTAIKQGRGQSRIFTFGIGNSVNRFLIDAMSLEGKGDSEFVTLAESADKAADRFVERLRAPVLTDISVRTLGLSVSDILPKEIPDVFSDRPIVIQGRYAVPGRGVVEVSGRVGGEPWSQKLNLDFPGRTGDTEVATLWARKKVDDLTECSFEREFFPDIRSVDYKNQIVDVALQFGIMTEFTSFVAVEPRVINVGGKVQTVHVPVEMADGVSYRGIYGGPGAAVATSSFAAAKSSGFGGAGGGGFGGRSFGLNAPSEAQSIGLIRHSRSVVDKLEGTSGAPKVDRYATVVDRRLRQAVGRVSVTVYLNRLDKTVEKELTKLGLVIAETDSTLRILFGTCAAKDLKKLSEVGWIDRIEPLG